MMTLILFIVFFFIQCSRQWFLFKLTIFIILFCVLLIVSRLFAIISHFLQQQKKIASYRDSFAFICESYALSFESYAFIRSFYYLRKWLQWAFVSLRISAQNKKKLHQNCLFLIYMSSQYLQILIIMR